MFFIAKKIFWISMFLVILSSVYPPSYLKNTTKDNQMQTEIKDVVIAVSSTVDYARNICNEKPELCVLWKKIIHDTKVHTLNGARIAYNFAKSTLGKYEKENSGNLDKK
ncbi:DUF5330 domain-containing protein [Candidatus Liberibacter africanus]|nr:DUF5330 domain-containing protein [Candidatus Liberibacter africanus]